MMNTFIFFLVLIHVSGTLYAPRLLISRAGRSVTIKCYYETTSANRHGRKYWCKESTNRHSCQTIISTNDFIHKDYEGRVSMHDSPQSGILQVTMAQLVKTDSSNYRCGIGNKNAYGFYAGVNLTIWEGPNMPKSPEILWGKVRGSVMIQCPVETAKSSMRKSFCKMRRSGCSLIADTSMNKGKQQEGRIIFTAGNSSETFRVFINKLRKEDSGMYKCGTGTSDDNASSSIIQLEVTEELVFFNIVNDTATTYEPQTIWTSPQSYVTATNEVYKQRLSETELNLLPIVIPILLGFLVLAAAVIIVFLKIRKRKKGVIVQLYIGPAEFSKPAMQ
uniref:high affinity immunoglobulin alpha and immunoglobulin mu Fc receptor n=1 Tax=Podarcis muralis TaxID=64176 RepID=UPI0010A0A117|nr:high affinity immunoglobulin alpha and immunoglobulin mu Fc receptor [Podarcis muralis]